MDSLTLPSYAKINLGLLLLNKRDDGYHNIATIFQQIDLCDELTFHKTPRKIHISSTNPQLPVNEKNLVYRAIELFRNKFGIQKGLDVHIHKQIPTGAGLGGGSSNAAVALLAANRIWGTKISPAELQPVALKIGSDVPFFLTGGTALGEGRGEILTPLPPLPDCWILLVCPDIHVATSWAYSQAKITLTKDEKLTKFRSIFRRYDFHALKEKWVNDFEGVVFSRHPVLQGFKDQMYERDAFYASMSGSGSTIYGFFQDRGKAERADQFFSKQAGLRTFLCRPMKNPVDG